MLVHIIQWVACQEAFKMDIKEIYRSLGTIEKNVVGIIQGA